MYSQFKEAKLTVRDLPRQGYTWDAVPQAKGAGLRCSETHQVVTLQQGKSPQSKEKGNENTWTPAWPAACARSLPSRRLGPQDHECQGFKTSLGNKT